MIRAFLLILAIALFVAAAGLITVTAAHASPVPDDAGSDCGWHEDGTTITIGDETYTCHCAELTGPMGKQVLCRWYAESALPKATRKRVPTKPKPRLHAKPKPTIRVYPKPSVVA